MAVFLRTPQHYLGLLEHALARAGVPAYFDRGTRRPDPAGRAFLALLSCAIEGLSARRFDEYLSLGQVPRAGRRARRRREPRGGRLPVRRMRFRALGAARLDDPDAAPPIAPADDSDRDAIVRRARSVRPGNGRS